MAEIPTIAPKPAAGVFTGACVVLGISILERQGVSVSGIEASAATVIASGFAMWLIPPTIRRKLNGEES